MTFQSKPIKCFYCGTTFPFSLEDQEFSPLHRAGISPICGRDGYRKVSLSR